jgi:hypothetical protein
VLVGAPDESLTRFSGLAAVTELAERLDVTDRVDAAVGSIKVRDRGFTTGQVLVGMAAVQLCARSTAVTKFPGYVTNSHRTQSQIERVADHNATTGQVVGTHRAGA